MQISGEQYIRIVNLSYFTDSKLEEPYLSIYNEIEYIFQGISTYYSKKFKYKNGQFYGYSKDEICFIVEYNVIYVDNRLIWLKFEEYSLEYKDVQKILKYYIEKRFNINSCRLVSNSQVSSVKL